ncbi:hypothetical protein C6X98_20235 [Bacillus pumilus]|nr:hypothetical protein C6X98_20235 [Bacillus pumilus]
MWNMRKTPSFSMLFSIIKRGNGNFKEKNKIFSTAWAPLWGFFILFLFILIQAMCSSLERIA